MDGGGGLCIRMAGMASTLRIAMGQMRVQQGRPAENLARAVSVVEEAARRGAGLVVLPECLDLGWLANCVREGAREIPGESFMELARAARENGIHVAAGLTEARWGSPLQRGGADLRWR